MSEPEQNPLESSLERLTTERTPEQKTMEDLARDVLKREDDALTRNLSQLERLAGLDDPGG